MASDLERLDRQRREAEARAEVAEARLAKVEALCAAERLPHVEYTDLSVPVADRRSVLRPVVFVHDVLAAAQGTATVMCDPHAFYGSGGSQWCDTCGEAETDPIHSEEGDRG